MFSGRPAYGQGFGVRSPCIAQATALFAKITELGVTIMDTDTSIDNPNIDWSFLYFQPIRFETVPDVGPVLPEQEDMSAPAEVITAMEPPSVTDVPVDPNIIDTPIVWVQQTDWLVL